MDISRLREAHRQGCIDPFGACVYWKDSPSAPPAPDYAAAAQAQQTNQVTPIGNSSWTPAVAATPGTAAVPGHWNGTNNGQGGNNLQWVPGTPATPGTPGQAAIQTTTLTPDLQKGLLGITGRVGDSMSHGPDLSSVQDVSDKAYSALTSRLDPQWAQNQQQTQTQLANQGLAPGSEAYDNAMRVFNQGKNDAYQQANLGAIQTMPQTYQLANDQYNQPLNQLNAIRTGAQIQGPQYQTAGNMLGAAQSQGQYNQGLYNAQVGQQNAMTSGLFGLGSAGMMALAMSDRRLKRDIRKVADDERGFGIYRYRYLHDDRERLGVMADEVEHLGVVHLIGGFKAVDYGKLYGA